MSDDTAIAIGDILKPAYKDAKGLKEAIGAIKHEMASLLDKDTDYLEVVDKKTNAKKIAIVKSGCQKLQAYYGVSVEVVKHDIQELPDGNVIVTAYAKAHKGPLSQTKSGSCSSAEKEAMKGGKIEARMMSDIFAQADTRACGRALNTFLCTGMLTAEELGAEVVKETPMVKVCTCWTDKQKPDPKDASKCLNCNGVIKRNA